MKRLLFLITMILTGGFSINEINGATLNAYIENASINGGKYSFDVYFERTDTWGPVYSPNAFGSSTATFSFNVNALTNPDLSITSGGPLDNVNYPNIALFLYVNTKNVLVDFGFALNQIAIGQLPLNTKVKTFTVSFDIVNPDISSELGWDPENTFFFTVNDDQITTTFFGSGNILLPIELSSFTASSSNKKVNLIWQTKTEVNNYGFEVERKSQSQTTSLREGALDWEKVGFVAGSGNSNSAKDYKFTDNTAAEGLYVYRLKQVDNDGTFSLSKEVEVEIKVMPVVYALEQNYPNPFNPGTTIKFSLPEKTNIKLSVYNALGEMVKELYNGEKSEGFHEVKFDASGLSSGMYFYKIESEAFTSTKKMLLVK